MSSLLRTVLAEEGPRVVDARRLGGGGGGRRARVHLRAPPPAVVVVRVAAYECEMEGNSVETISPSLVYGEEAISIT